TEVGNFTVTLMVEDAWGNVDEDICLVQVLAPKEEKPPSDDMWGGLVLMTVISICILVPAFFLLSGNKRQKDLKRG
ncbi:MAG: hypothetical protein KAW09_09595, partial [Thermoplasmata archaeon]|nr:hypothetical protein [Thermoplasmata archaeon]